MKRSVLLSFLVMLVFASCDIIEQPFVELPPGACVAPQDCLDLIPADPFEGVTIKQKVMLEEFTGHRCGNCPTASEIALKLRDETFADDMILVTIHAGGLAAYDSSDSKFNVNYTTESGDEIFDFFFPADAVPFALLNRTQLNAGFFLYSQNQWETKVGELLQEAPTAGIRITPCYDAASRELVSIVDLKFLEEATDKEHISLFLIEDKVKGWQKDYRLPQSDENIKDYEHHDMFRAALNGTWGQPLSSAVIEAGKTFRITNCYTVPEYMDADHLKVVAFIHNFETREVRQVEVAEIN